MTSTAIPGVPCLQTCPMPTAVSCHWTQNNNRWFSMLFNDQRNKDKNGKKIALLNIIYIHFMVHWKDTKRHENIYVEKCWSLFLLFYDVVWIAMTKYMNYQLGFATVTVSSPAVLPYILHSYLCLTFISADMPTRQTDTLYDQQTTQRQTDRY